MKYFTIFFILFCLVFLNVPKSFIHTCESQHSLSHHDHNEDHKHSEEHQQTDYEVFDVDIEKCFICDFDLSVFSYSIETFPSFSAFTVLKLTDRAQNDYILPDFSAYSHRGPPTV